jgi:hypothetical protein
MSLPAWATRSPLFESEVPATRLTEPEDPSPVLIVEMSTEPLEPAPSAVARINTSPLAAP